MSVQPQREATLLAHHQARCITNLKRSIETMREACDEAERAINDAAKNERTLGVAIPRMLHTMTWGFANASSHIESALDALEDGHTIERITLQQALPVAPSPTVGPEATLG